MLRVNLYLDPELEQKLLKIKAAKGLKKNPEVIRTIIAEYYERVLGGSAK